MIDLYTANTPNGQRGAVALEEFGLPYRLHKVEIFSGGATRPEFLRLNPNARIPVIVDPDGPGGGEIIVTQSWAILIYLAEKTGRYMPADPRGRLQVLEWTFHLAADVMMVHSAFNQVSMFVPEKVPSTIAFYEERLLGALRNLDRRLGEADYLAGDLSIADFGLYPVYHYRKPLLQEHPELANLIAWGKRMDARPACVRGVQATQ